MPYADRPTELDDVSLTLLRAADYIREHGWCQGEHKDEKGAVCIMGAIHAAVSDYDVNTYGLASDAMEAGRRFFRFVGEIPAPTWNDAPGRTKEEVIAALEAAAYGDAK